MHAYVDVPMAIFIRWLCLGFPCNVDIHVQQAVLAMVGMTTRDENNVNKDEHWAYNINYITYVPGLYL